MMRTAALLLTTLALTGCSSMTWNRYDPQTPATAEGQAQADHQRQRAQAICGAEGTVSQRDDTDGTRAGDWKCERRKP
jgi:PBP1b-binding outer membrane lipoprotein LpoB